MVQRRLERDARSDRDHPVWVSWQPTWDVLGPILIALMGTTALYLGVKRLGMIEVNVLFWVVSAFYILAACYVCLVLRRRGLHTLGLREDNWGQAMVVGAVSGLLLGIIQLYLGLQAGHPPRASSISLELLAFAITLALIVAGEEVLYRGWFQASLEPAFGLIPSLLVASLAYAVSPLLIPSTSNEVIPGMVTPLKMHPGVIVFLALFLNAIYRFTGSLWSSGAANFLCRFTLVFVWSPQQLTPIQPALALAVALALWAVIFLYVRRWHKTVNPTCDINGVRIARSKR